MNEKISITNLPHLCENCSRQFPTCKQDVIVFGINLDESLTGAPADKIIACGSHQNKDALFYNCLQHSGVDNWGGFEYSVEEYNQIIESNK